jgi:hypothetical protein
MPELFDLCKILFAGSFVLGYFARGTIGVRAAVLVMAVSYLGCLCFSPNLTRGILEPWAGVFALGFAALMYFGFNAIRSPERKSRVGSSARRGDNSADYPITKD